MASSMRCKITGCDLDECGKCRRCGDESKANHDFKSAERDRPCFTHEICERCQTEREQPDHDWGTTPHGLKCTRCNLSI